MVGFSLSTKYKNKKVIFLAVWLKVICKIILALYFGYAKVILNKSLTRRKANITAVRQSHSSLDEYHKSVRIYLVAESLVGTRLIAFFF